MMIEWLPIVKKGMMKAYNRHVKEDLGGKTPKVWLQCPNYPVCPRDAGFRDLMDRTKTVRHAL